MLFNSYIFIFLFLPVCLVGFCFIRRRNVVLSKLWLTGCSLWFYGYFNAGYLLVMLTSIAFNYAVYRWMTAAKAALKSGRKQLFIGVAGNILLLAYFKYTDFLIECFDKISGHEIPPLDILLPLGISFFTFQQIGFIADVYRDRVKECTFIDYILFVSFFPQLIAGPIVSSGQMLPQYGTFTTDTVIDTDKLARGIFIFVLGLSKKVLIADTFGGSVDYVYGSLSGGISSVEALLTILFYTLQIYFDFSGYCDMAIGLGMMFGIDIPVNFDSPYKSKNITEFWRRWHMTLNRFLTEYVYIPLGGSRKGRLRTYVNLMIVFIISGIWHGAGFTFILWGLMHGIMSVITRLIQDKTDIRCKGVFSQLITFTFICVAWVFFRADTVSDACIILKNAAGIGGYTSYVRDGFLEVFNSGEYWYLLKLTGLTEYAAGRYIVMAVFTVFGIVAVFACPNVRELADRLRYRVSYGIMTGLLFIWCVLSLSGVSTFLYYNF